MKIEFTGLELDDATFQENPDIITDAVEIFHDYEDDTIKITLQNATVLTYPRNSFYRMEIY